MRKIIKVDGFKRIDLSTSPTNKSDLKVTYILRSNKKNYLTSKSLYFKVGMGDLILVENESSVKKVDTKLTDKKWKVKIDDKKFFIDRVKDSENNWFLSITQKKSKIKPSKFLKFSKLKKIINEIDYIKNIHNKRRINSLYIEDRYKIRITDYFFILHNFYTCKFDWDHSIVYAYNKFIFNAKKSNNKENSYFKYLKNWSKEGKIYESFSRIELRKGGKTMISMNTDGLYISYKEYSFFEKIFDLKNNKIKFKNAIKALIRYKVKNLTKLEKNHKPWDGAMVIL